MTITAPLLRYSSFRAAPGKGDDVARLLAEIKDYILQSDGNHGIQVMRQCDDADCFVVVEGWADEASHKASLAAYPDKQKMADAMQLFAEPPKGHYFTEI